MTNKNPRGQNRPMNGHGKGSGNKGGARVGKNQGKCLVGGPGKGKGQGQGKGAGREK